MNEADNFNNTKLNKISRNSNETKIIDDVYEEYVEKKDFFNSSNALVKDTQVGNKLDKIEEQLNAIVDRQKKGVSAEFNALMDGYVNKANESQEYKVKANHLESLYEELKIETKTLKETNKKLKEDLEAAKEALRMSEADIKRLKEESEYTRRNHLDEIKTLTDARDALSTKFKELQVQNDENLKSYNAVKTELLEQRYKLKQFEQEKKVEDDSAKRTNRENSKLIEELKEKLDLRTREVEYKDALLNQLIKQVSVEDNFKSRLNPNSPKAKDIVRQAQIGIAPKSLVIEEEDEEQKPDDTDFDQDFFNDEESIQLNTKPKTIRESIASRFLTKKKNDSELSRKSSWGPFKKQ